MSEPTDPGRARPRARIEAARLDSECLRDELLGLTRRLTSGTYELLVLVGELDARGTWALWGALSCAAWLAGACDIEAGTAHNQVRVARAMRTFAALDAAMAAGDVSYAKARVLVPCLTDANVDELIGIAETTPACPVGCGDRGVVATKRRPRRDQPPPTRGALHVVAHRGRRDDRGHPPLHPRGRRRLLRGDRRPGHPKQRSRGSVTRATARGCHRQPGQQRWRDRDHRSRRARPRRRQHPHRRHTPVRSRRHPDAPRQRSCHCSSTTHSANRSTPAPDDASRPDAKPGSSTNDTTNAPTRAAPPGTFLQHDHIQPYPQGGPTILDNLQRLCGPHNRAKNPRRTT